MTVADFSLAVFRFSLILLPIIAAVVTATTSINFYILLGIWSIELFKGLGYDIIQHFYSNEFQLYFFGILALRSVYLVQLDLDSAYWWGCVAILELTFTIVKMFPKLRPYFDSWQFTEKDKERYHREVDEGSQTVDEEARNTLDRVNIVDLLALIGSISVFNALRIGLIYYYDYDGSLPWYNDDQSRNLEMYTGIADAVLIIVVCLRLPSIRNRYSEDDDFIQDFGGPILIYLLFNIMQLWSSYNTTVTVLIIAQIVSVFIALIYTRRSMTRQSGSIADTFLLGMKEFIVDVVEILISEPVGQMLYVFFVAFTIYLSNDLLYSSVVQFPANIQTISCIPYNFVNSTLKDMWEITSDPLVAAAMSIFSSDISRLRLQAATLVNAAYPTLTIICLGLSTTLNLSRQWLIAIFSALPWISALVIISQPFEESRRLLQMPGFWALSAGACFISIFVVQVVGDAQVTIMWLVVDSTYTRTWTNEGIVYLMLQILMTLMCMWQWYQQSVDERVRKFAKGDGTGFAGAAIVDNIESLAMKIVTVVTTPGLFMIALAFALVTYLSLNNFLIDSITLVKITNQSGPDWLQVSSGDKAIAAFTSLAGMFGKKVQSVVGLINIAAVLVQSIDIPCIDIGVDNICIGDLISGGLDTIIGGIVDGLNEAFAVAIDPAIDAVVDIIGGQIQKLNDALGSLDILSNIDDIALFSVPSFGINILRFPSWLTYVGYAVAAVLAVLLIASLFYSHVAIDLGIKAITMGVLSAGAAVIPFAVQAYWFIQQYGYQIQLTFNQDMLWVWGVALVVFAIGVLLTIAPYIINSDNPKDSVTGTKFQPVDSDSDEEEPIQVSKYKMQRHIMFH